MTAITSVSNPPLGKIMQSGFIADFSGKSFFFKKRFYFMVNIHGWGKQSVTMQLPQKLLIKFTALKQKMNHFQRTSL